MSGDNGIGGDGGIRESKCAKSPRLCGSEAAQLCGSEAAQLCGSEAAQLCGSEVLRLRGSAREKAFADAKRSLRGRRELRERHSGENSNAGPRNCGQEPATAVSSQGVVEAVNGDAPATQGRDQKLSMQLNAKSAMTIATVASDAAIGGYATSRNFPETLCSLRSLWLKQLDHSTSHPQIFGIRLINLSTGQSPGHIGPRDCDLCVLT